MDLAHSRSWQEPLSLTWSDPKAAKLNEALKQFRLTRVESSQTFSMTDEQWENSVLSWIWQIGPKKKLERGETRRWKVFIGKLRIFDTFVNGTKKEEEMDLSKVFWQKNVLLPPRTKIWPDLNSGQIKNYKKAVSLSARKPGSISSEWYRVQQSSLLLLSRT